MDMNDNQTAAEQSYLTVAQAAQQLRVHPSTIRRWIDSGLLRAYRVGQKRIAIQPSDLARMVARHDGGKKQKAKTGEVMKIGDRAPWRLTKEEQERGLRALEKVRQFREQLAKKYGKSEVEGWVLLNESREERTRQLMGEMDS
jgi:excisionase family DNA binding protein